MSYKITRKNEAYRYEAAKHFDVRTTRLHDPQDVNDGVVTMGLSHFLPGGGCVRPYRYSIPYFRRNCKQFAGESDKKRPHDGEAVRAVNP